MKRSNTQNRQLHALINRLGIDEETKQGMVMTYTDSRTDRSSEMNTQECQELIDNLAQQNAFDPKADKMRKKIIAHFIKMGHTVNGKIDLVELNAWCKHYGYLHKRLNSYTVEELPKLVTQVENVYKTFKDSIT